MDVWTQVIARGKLQKMYTHVLCLWSSSHAHRDEHTLNAADFPKLLFSIRNSTSVTTSIPYGFEHLIGEPLSGMFYLVSKIGQGKQSNTPLKYATYEHGMWTDLLDTHCDWKKKDTWSYDKNHFSYLLVSVTPDVLQLLILWGKYCCQSKGTGNGLKMVRGGPAWGWLNDFKHQCL